ncbi:DUF4272 domain-containing protein [Flavobacterium sp. GCM10027622]|uniref:DUF4272 domain-containing protein n=1 Tax=unclassified Flavobacterium TaxID=196869 RepID=UPI003608B52C
MRLFDIFKKTIKADSPKTAYQRKKQNESYLKALNIPILEHLPYIEEESDVRLRSAQEIAERILVLVYLGFASEIEDERENVIAFLKSNSLWEKVSPEEKELFEKEVLTEQEIINIFWRSEAIWMLLWTICKVDKLKLPTEQIEIEDIVSRIPELFSDSKAYIENAIIRPTSELLDASDLTYRLHWATRDASLNNQPMPANLILSVIMERHYAINWVTFYGEEWDEIGTDT